ncbi:MAG: multiheme c-type cytochrome, partial [Deltaproteobacteria bacterium]|nr:multiheme c-type cytochrome [Deltaproteobacteria bacterium]
PALDCQPGTAPAVDDGVGCTIDSCDEATDTIVHTPDDTACDDTLFCNGAETCDPALDCQPGTAPAVDDGVGCTIDSCDEATDTIVHGPDDTACDDTLFCNGAETCDPALDCQPGLTPSCDDTVSCTVDTCDAGLDACTSTPDDLLCGGGQTCDLFLGCIGGGDSCAAPIVIPGTGTYPGDTSTGFATHSGSCGGSGAELVYQLTLGADSDVYLETAGSALDTVLHLRAADCDTGAELQCHDDVDSADATSRLLLPALGPGTYFVFVDSASGGGAFTLNVVVTPVGISTTPAVSADPLLRLPGTQPTDGVTLEAVGRCLNCHDGYDATVEPGSHWKGTMMAQASRDPLFWGTFAVGLQDSVWLMGNANAGDLCLRCHFPAGWLEGRSDPPTGTAMTGADYEGVSCDTCHRMFDPFHEDTWAGTREGNDWLNYWDETNASLTPSQAAADATRAADRTEAAALTLFNGNPAFDGTSHPVNAGWTEASSAQMFIAGVNDKRASFADAAARHGMQYSRFHKSKYLCATCHDVSNPVLANLAFAGTPPGDGTTILTTEAQSASSYGHVERTFSEFMLSAYGLQGGAAGTGPYAPGVFTTSKANDYISSCQDCHLPDGVGKGCDKNDGILRPTGSVEHPQCGQPVHDLTGGNAWVPWLLASVVPGSPNYDPANEALLAQGPAALTLDLAYGQPLDPGDLLAASNRAIATLQKAATVENVAYDPGTGTLDFRIDNHTGHKLISGYPEGRRFFANIKVYQGATLLQEVNPYDATVGTLKGLPDPGSPALGPGETHVDALVYESHPRSSLTGEEHTFHFVLATDRYKDNRIPPKGFRIGEAAARMSEPAWQGSIDPGYFTPAEYAGGWDDVTLSVAPGADRIEIRLYYQTTSREYVAFLRDEILGVGTSLPSPTPSGRALAYVLQTDPAFSQLAAWGDTMWQLWDHNKDAPGAAPIECAQGVWP